MSVRARPQLCLLMQGFRFGRGFDVYDVVRGREREAAGGRRGRRKGEGKGL